MSDIDTIDTEVRKSINNLFRNLNMMGREKEVQEAVIAVFRQEHRTLQQQFFNKIIIPIIKHCAKMNDEHLYDLRNEATVKLAKKIEPIINVSLPFI